MQIKKLELKNFAGFKELAIDFAPQNENQGKVTVFIGDNGCGKTAVLRALALSLSWLVARIKREKGSGNSIAPLDSSANFDDSHAVTQISLMVEENNQKFHWTLVKNGEGKKKQTESSLNDTSKLADIYRTQLTKNNKASFPLMIYYPVERVVLDIPLRIKTKHNFEQLEGYDNSLQGIDFRRFFEWFKDREDFENEIRLKQLEQKLSDLQDYSQKGDISIFEATKEYFSQLNNPVFYDCQLVAVRKAIKSFMPNFDNLRINRKPRLQMIVDKKCSQLTDILDISQLSQGEKSLIALVGDIARRLAMMNPGLENPLLGNGVVLIDEIDLHLHPKWQRSIVHKLQTTFPNCQFILTTHSPAVISDSPHLLVYELNNAQVTQLPNLYGMDVNMVLLQEMDTDVRNTQIQQQLDELLNAIQLQELDNAKEKLAVLEKQIPSEHLELIKARLLLRKMELRHAQNQQKS